MIQQDLMRAVQNNDAAAITSFLALTPKLFKYHENALKVALDKKHWEVANILLEKGVSTKALDGDTYLPDAAIHGETKTVELLIASGVNVNVVNSFGYTALSSAAKSGHVNTVKSLIKLDCDLEKKYFTGETALLLAVGNDQYTSTELLLDAGANIHAEERNKKTALFIAITKNNTQLIELLLNKGANVDSTCVIKDENGESEITALMYASRSGKPEAIKALLNGGADAYALDRHGKTAIQYATERKYPEITNLIESFMEEKKLAEAILSVETFNNHHLNF